MLLFIELLIYRLISFFRINNGKNGVTLLKFDGLGDLAIMLNALNRFDVPNQFRPFILVTKHEFVELAKIVMPIFINFLATSKFIGSILYKN